MTYQEFLQKLSETPRRWYLEKSPEWPAAIRFRPDAGLEMCPITAVHGDKSFGVSRFCDAGLALGLGFDLSCNIAAAADGPEPWDPDGLLSLDREAIRRDLLRACGLAPSSWQPDEQAFLASVRALSCPPQTVGREA